MSRYCRIEKYIVNKKSQQNIFSNMIYLFFNFMYIYIYIHRERERERERESDC